MLLSCGNATKAGNNSVDSISTSTAETAEVEEDATKNELYPFTLKGIEDAIDGYDYDPKEHVYILYDIDGDGQNEMFIKERVKNYNNFFVLNIEDGKVNLIDARTSGGMEDFLIYDDGYVVHVIEGRDRMFAANYKLVKSKVVAESQYRYDSDWSGWEEGDKEPEIDESWTVNGKEVKESEYNKYSPSGESFSLYNIDGWKDFNVGGNESKAAVEQLKTSGRLVNELVPSSWECTQSAKGDLNKDGIKDLVIITLPNNKENILKREDGYEKNLNTPVVAVYLCDEYGQYKLWKTSTAIVPAMDEYMSIEGMSVEIKSNGVLWVKYSDFYSAGTADVTDYTQLYRVQDGGFYLIGNEEHSFSRYSHEEVTTSTNYLSNKRITRVSKSSGGRSKEEVETIEKKPLRSFEQGL